MSNAGIFLVLSTLELTSMEASLSQGRQRDWVDETYTLRSEHEPSRLLDIDVAWDAIHRCLGDGSLNEDSTRYPLRAVILGGQKLGDDDGLIMRLNGASAVRDLSARLQALDETTLRACYFAIDADSYLIAPNEDDFQYTRYYFQALQTFYGQAAEHGESMLFVAYQ